MNRERENDMDTRLAVLDAFLREVDGPLNIETKEDRLKTQKAVYLGQLSGVDLGYRYNWYVHGPYSPNLTQDYYALNALTDQEQIQVSNSSLNEHTKIRLNRIKSLFNVPNGVGLNKAGWLELLASWHYLLKVARQSDEKARATMAQQKHHISPYINQADETLRAAGIL